MLELFVVYQSAPGTWSADFLHRPSEYAKLWTTVFTVTVKDCDKLTRNLAELWPRVPVCVANSL